jgi:hypothetical protein
MLIDYGLVVAHLPDRLSDHNRTVVCHEFIVLLDDIFHESPVDRAPMCPSASVARSQSDKELGEIICRDLWSFTVAFPALEWTWHRCCGISESSSNQSGPFDNSSQVKSSQVKSSQVKSSQVKSSQVKSYQVISSQVISSHIKSSHIKSSQVIKDH